MVRSLKMHRAVASATYDVYITSLSVDGVTTREAMDNLVKSVKSQARFVDKSVAFEDVADDSLAREVARELGYKTR